MKLPSRDYSRYEGNSWQYVDRGVTPKNSYVEPRHRRECFILCSALGKISDLFTADLITNSPRLQRQGTTSLPSCRKGCAPITVLPRIIHASSLALLAFLWPLFLAASSRGADTALYAELVKKAKAEREVEYWSPMNEEPANRILKVFGEKFAINARFMRWVDTGVQQRNLIEMQSGRALRADLMAPNREAQQQFLDAGAFQKPPYEYLKVWPGIDKRQYDPSGWALNLSGNSRAIVYNTNLVSTKQIPKTWDDCARPEFKSKVVLDVRHKLYALHFHRRAWFLDWIKRMVANDVKLIRGQTEVMQPMAAGAYALFCSAQPYTAQTMIDKGIKNLKIAVPGELLMESAEAAFVRKGSPHPHAAQLLAGWLTSTEGQRLLDKEDYKGFPWVPGTFNAKLAAGNKVLFCDPECATKAGEMSGEYLRALGLPVTQ